MSPRRARSHRGAGAAIRWAPFLVPVLYLAVILSLQPSDRLGAPESFPGVGRLLYDDYDAMAFALRGFNAEGGRSAGRLTDPCREPATPAEIAAKAPLAPYYLEYPHTALLLFRLPYWLPPAVRDSWIAPFVGNACHNAVVEHRPQTAEERALWQKLRQASRVYVAIGLVCLIGLMLVIRSGYEPGARLSGSMLLLLLPATLYFSANRFDVVPALLVALSLACLGRDRIVASGLLLGVATMVKVYPALAAPFVAGYLIVNRRRTFTWLGAFGAAMLAIGAWTVATNGWEAALAPYRVQLTRPLDAFTFYGYLLPTGWGGSSPAASAFRAGVVLLVVALLAWRRPPDLASVLRRSAVVLIVFVSLQVFYSPQWVLWLAPFLVPLASKDRPVLWLVIAWDVVTYLTFPVAFDLRAGDVMTVLVYARAAVVVTLIVALVRAELPAIRR